MTDEELADDILTKSKRASGGMCPYMRDKLRRPCCQYHEGMADGLDVFLDRRSKGA